MPDTRQTGLDPVHILAICTRATGRRVLVVPKAGGIVVCILPSRRTADRATTALGRVGYEVTSVSAARGRDLLVTGWDPAVLESRLTTMRTVLYQLADNPPLTAKAVIERFRALPPGSRTQLQQWELLNQAHAGLRGWVTSRSGIHALNGSAVQPADTGVALRLRAAAALEQGIDDQVQRQLRVAGYALALFRQLAGRTDGDTAEATAIRWAGITFHLSSPIARDSSQLMPRATEPAQGTAKPGHQAARTSDAGVRPMTLPAGSLRLPGPAGRIAVEFPSAALTTGPPATVARLDSARRGVRPGPRPRLHP